MKIMKIKRIKQIEGKIIVEKALMKKWKDILKVIIFVTGIIEKTIDYNTPMFIIIQK